ncbi:hypothetical protein [Rhizobium ruizarguesonis]|uniref:hypothetical protein n=1 Tax=Rhizobium ruizarguesonis TaxID=2081791 RepID=UPI001FE23621|nr:hypothetical protein [Rhizobium ruizarguesonis]
MFHELQPVDMLLKPKDEWIQSRNEEASTGSKISSIRKYTYDEPVAFRDHGVSSFAIENKAAEIQEGYRMTENVVSFEEKRLERLDDTVFGSTAEEYRIAAIGSQIEFAKRELETVQAYIDLAYAGTITVTMNDCGEPPPQQPFAHLGSILSNYEQVLFDRIAELEYEQEILSSPADDEGY